MKWLLRFLGLVMLGIILFRVDLSVVVERLGNCKLEWAAAALGLNLVAITIKALRWHLMLRLQGIPFSFPSSVQAYFGAIFVGMATPGRIGELSRATYVKTRSCVSSSKALSSVVVDRLMDLYALLAVGLASVFHFDLAAKLSLVFMLFAGLVFVSPIILANPRIGRSLFQKVLAPLLGRKLRDEIEGGANDFYDGIEDLLGPRIFAGVLLTFVAYGTFFLAAYLLTFSVGVKIGYVEVVMAIGLANLLSLIPITVAGIGTRDAVLIFCFSAIGLGEPEALGFSVMVLAVFYLGTALAGMPFFFSTRQNKQNEGFPT